MEFKKFQKVIEAINTYYSFAVLAYVVAIYLAGHSHLFKWAALALTPLLAGWTGYMINDLIDHRFHRYGFRVLSNTMTYEVRKGGKYLLRFNTKLKAGTDRLMVYPVSYQWSGSGPGQPPLVSAEGQQLAALVRSYKSDLARIEPYVLTNSTQGDWRYWFITFNPPIYKGETVTIKYSQEFHDAKGTAKPYMYYFVRVPMKRLVLHVKFPPGQTPASVRASYTKPTDPKRMYGGPTLDFDPGGQWATWVVNRPKLGYCYRIHW